MKPMRILYTIPNFDTAGSGKALMNLAQRLNPNFFEPQIACLHNRGEYFKTVKESGIPVHVFDYISPCRPIPKMIAGSWKVAGKLRALAPDLIHSFHYSSDYTEGLAANMARIPWIFTKKNMGWYGASNRAWKLRSMLAKGIVVQNTDMAEQFYNGSAKVCLIPRGIDSDRFAPRPPDLQLRKSMKTSVEARIIICVANMVPVKGVELLVEAFSKLKDRHPEWVVWLVGDVANEYGAFLIARVRELGLEDTVLFSGKQIDVRGYLDHAEVFVLPTKDEGRREGSPVAMLEAMANAKVVLGSNVPGIKDQLCRHREHLFSAGNCVALENRLNSVMERSVDDNRQAGAEFRRFAVREFTIREEVRKHEEFYFQLLGERNRR